MQKPLNAKEHNQAFLKFIFFFALTVAMVTGALFINFEVPAHELKILRERSDNYRNHLIAQESFRRTLNEFITIADRSDSSSRAMIESEALPKLDALRNANLAEDSASGHRMNLSIYRLANQYLSARAKLADSHGFDGEMQRLKDKIEQLRGDLKDCGCGEDFSN